jgi:hypothetical protein
MKTGDPMICNLKGAWVSRYRRTWSDIAFSPTWNPMIHLVQVYGGTVTYRYVLARICTALYSLVLSGLWCTSLRYPTSLAKPIENVALNAK